MQKLWAFNNGDFENHLKQALNNFPELKHSQKKPFTGISEFLFAKFLGES